MDFSKKLRRGLMTFIAAFAVGVSAILVAPAFAEDYPTWSEVQAAKSNTKAKNAEVQKVKDAVAGLQTKVNAARKVAGEKQAVYNIARAKFDEATVLANALQEQADQKQHEADVALRAAQTIVSAMSRNTSSDLTMTIMFESSGENADEVLSKIGSLSRVGDQAAGIYSRAVQAANTAQALQEQAEQARIERERLAQEAEAALSEARAAQATVESALKEQQNKQFEFEQQLAYLQSTEKETVAAYQRGVEERNRLAALAAQGGGLPGGWISNAGWANPVSGRLGSGYGPRAVICSAGGCSSNYHRGLDFAAACGTPIYATSAGRVITASWVGTYGNFVKIDHGGGVHSGYAHIRTGGTLVSPGQFVDTGDLIAYVGTTGASTGCHLHFEIYDSLTNRIDPLPFLRARGVNPV